jgi:hypothetical protein
MPGFARFYKNFMLSVGIFFYSPIQFLQKYSAFVDREFGFNKFVKYITIIFSSWAFFWLLLSAISVKVGGFGIVLSAPKINFSLESLDLKSIANIPAIFTEGFAMAATPNMNFAVSGSFLNSIIQYVRERSSPERRAPTHLLASFFARRYLQQFLDFVTGFGDAQIVPDDAFDQIADAASAAAEQAAAAAEAAAEQAAAAAEAAAVGAMAAAESGALNAAAQAASLAAAGGNFVGAADALMAAPCDTPDDMEAPEGAPADWSEKYSMLMQKSADMVTTELPNLQEFCNKMDQFIAADKAYRAGYSETKATIGDKTWDDGVPGTQARCYFIGVWQGANAMFGEGT